LFLCDSSDLAGKIADVEMFNEGRAGFPGENVFPGCFNITADGRDKA